MKHPESMIHAELIEYVRHLKAMIAILQKHAKNGPGVAPAPQDSTS